ncbi:hypothetical protein AB0C90_38370 [Streptomyces sp. NPDC048550]|uniref:hypothetical protein n=1 Tax=Streptomyces sp. NPDC048550 TaxID=3155739 RepID=UPI00341D3DB8
MWQLLATSYVEDGVRGIMFDAGGAFQRQGFAAFHDAIKGEDSRRAQLRTHVHELGHAFNLLHSWQKNLADPPQPLGPNGGFGDRSWMNYVQNYQPPPPAPGGQAAYWADFPFQFTDSELVHLRHGFYRDVIMGSNPFGVGAAEIDVDLFDNPVIDNSGLTLELRSNGSFLFGEPVVIEVKLATTDLRGCVTHGRLHPKDGFVTVAIRTPSGEAKVYRPVRRPGAPDGPGRRPVSDLRECLNRLRQGRLLLPAARPVPTARPVLRGRRLTGALPGPPAHGPLAPHRCGRGRRRVDVR